MRLSHILLLDSVVLFFIAVLQVFTISPRTIPEPQRDVREEVVETIKDWEGFRSTAYWDGSRYSIGYGTREETRGETISEEEATARLKEHLETWVFPAIPENVSPEVFVALADIGYNAGHRAIRDCVNEDGSLNVENYQKWVKANGGKSHGLVRRRTAMVIYVLGTKGENNEENETAEADNED